MKHCLIALSALLAAASAFAQGQVLLSNRGGGVDAPITFGAGKAEGTAYMAQLYASAPGGTLAPVGAPLPFRVGAGAGYIDPTGVDTTRTIPGVAANGTAQAQIRAWKVSSGATYEAAMATGGGYGESAILSSVATGGGTTPPTSLVGLTGFAIRPEIPEPGVAALGLLGAGLLAIRRKK